MQYRFGVFILVAACSSPDPQEMPSGDSAVPVAASLDQFRQLQWLAGSWHGRGGNYPSFFEEYRIVDDSTIQMRGLSDSTFMTATDSSWIEYRNGSIRKRGADREYVVVGLSADSVRFERPNQPGGGHTFTRTSADEWIATLHPSSAGGAPTVYTMRRINR